MGIYGVNGSYEDFEFKVEDEYLWSTKAFRLPLKIEFEVKFENEG